MKQTKSKVEKSLAGFVRVMENLESNGIQLWGMENCSVCGT